MLYQRGKKLYLEGADAEIAAAEQTDALEMDERGRSGAGIPGHPAPGKMGGDVAL